MAERGRNQGPGGRGLTRALGVSLLLVAVGLAGPLIYFALKASSEACAGSPPPEQVCGNATRHLERRLTWARQALRDAGAQAASCNQTALGLAHALSLEKEQSRPQGSRRAMDTLTQELREAEAEVERLRKAQRSPGGGSAASAGFSCGPGPGTAAALLLLGLGALRA